MPASDRVAVVTGAARGIGAACARRFIEEGLRVVIADKDEAAGEALAKDLDGGRDRAIFVHCDVSEKLQVANLMAETRSAFDRLDVLVNNAAILRTGDVLDLSVEDFDTVMGVNLRGAFLVARAAAKQMVEQIEAEDMRAEDCRKRYAMVNMSSVNARVAIPDQLAYVTSKGALNQMTKSMAVALAPWGVRVNAVGPGSINTDILKHIADDKPARNRILSRTPLARLGDPDEIAGVTWFLTSKDASYVTGECLYADGGRLALNYVMKPEDYED